MSSFAKYYGKNGAIGLLCGGGGLNLRLNFQMMPDYFL